MSDRTPETGSHAWMVKMTAEREEAEDRKPEITEPITSIPQSQPESWDTIQLARQPRKPVYLDRRHKGNWPTPVAETTPED